MKKVLIFLFFIPVFAMAQTPNSGYLLTKPDGTVGIGITSPAASSLLDVTSTTKGVLIPRMTTAQRDAIASPSTGLMIYNTTDSAFNFYRLSGWVSLNRGLSFTNGLTDSSGTVKLGGTLTEAITVLDGGVTNNLRFQDMLFEVTNSNILMLGDSISLTGGATPNRKSDIKLKNDTIKINPGIGLLYIDTLTSAVGTKALRYNPTTGLVSYADTTTGGSGGTPAGNYGNLQINRNGAFATPGSDSLDFTTGLDIKGHVGVSATSTTGIKFGGTTRIYDDGSLMRISPSGSAVQFYTAGIGNSLQIFNSAGSNSIVVDGQIGTIYRSSSTLSLQTTGNVGIGSGVGTSATARLHISAGTASANTAPFKLTSGTNLTTPEAGAMEYNGTNLFFTPSSAARNNILMTASVNSVSPTSPNRTITVVIDGTTYYIHAKTTND